MKRLLLSAVALCLACTATGARAQEELTPAASPAIDAALYPSPKPDIPAEVGWTMITNPAFHPYEMTYAHSYRALYPPYYYKNCHGLSCLPLVPKPHLVGTEVRVKYHSHYKLGSGFWFRQPKIHYHNNQVHDWYRGSGWWK